MKQLMILIKDIVIFAYRVIFTPTTFALAGARDDGPVNSGGLAIGKFSSRSKGAA